MGHSGSGKSTILNLIPRFYDRIKGDIRIDNQSIYNVTSIGFAFMIGAVNMLFLYPSFCKDA